MYPRPLQLSCSVSGYLEEGTTHPVWVTVQHAVLVNLLYYWEMSILGEDDYGRSEPK